MKVLMGLMCGLIFGFGLAASGMTSTAKVIGFLDVFGYWQPDLMFVMGGALAVTLISFRFILKRPKPILDSQMHLPANAAIDKKLLIGAAIFGVGWGLYGYCPGPAIASLVYLDNKTLIFLTAMLVGMKLTDLLTSKWDSKS